MQEVKEDTLQYNRRLATKKFHLKISDKFVTGLR